MVDGETSLVDIRRNLRVSLHRLQIAGQVARTGLECNTATRLGTRCILCGSGFRKKESRDHLEIPVRNLQIGAMACTGEREPLDLWDIGEIWIHTAWPSISP